MRHPPEMARAGSDDQVSFYEKTVSREVLDALAVIAYLRRLHNVPVHVVGISTGAIVAELPPGACIGHAYRTLYNVLQRLY